MQPIIKDLLVGEDGDSAIGDLPWGLELLRVVNKHLDDADAILPHVKLKEVLKTIEGFPKGKQFMILTMEISKDDPDTAKLAELLGMKSEDSQDAVSLILGISGAAMLGVLIAASIIAVIAGDWAKAIQLIELIVNLPN